ncbi:response regulator [Aureimonas psammosilenae]|uniref:response regulator n=1 Tax=Aureimonas psammosilenae TaxID=2495496 RepID=UPI0012610687|nr:response regulator [Aureimonas psammosilenae]
MKGLRILIVEDELILAMDLEDVLTDAGYEVVGLAADMHQALKIAASEKPDIAIMDVNLARGTNGVETARRLRLDLDVPSLFVSGNLDPKTRANAADCKPLGFVPKPFSHNDLLAHLKMAC